LFVALLAGMPQLAPLFHRAFPRVSPPVFGRAVTRIERRLRIPDTDAHAIP